MTLITPHALHRFHSEVVLQAHTATGQLVVFEVQGAQPWFLYADFTKALRPVTDADIDRLPALRSDINAG